MQESSRPLSHNGGEGDVDFGHTNIHINGKQPIFKTKQGKQGNKRQRHSTGGSFEAFGNEHGNTV